MDEMRSRITRGDIKIERAEAAKVLYILCIHHNQHIMTRKHRPCARSLPTALEGYLQHHNAASMVSGYTALVPLYP